MATERIGIVAFSFALRDEKREPNPCNKRLAEAVLEIVEKETKKVVIVAQWEVFKALRGMLPDHGKIEEVHKVKGPDNGEYLGSEEVMLRAAKIFAERGIQEAIPVANPFLHLAKCQRLVCESGLTLVEREIGRIGFDKESLQWWTRGPLRLLFYAVLQKLLGRRGK